LQLQEIKASDEKASQGDVVPLVAEDFTWER